MRACSACSAPITTGSKTGLCWPCSVKARRPAKTLICGHCHREYHPADGAAGLYCSRECAGLARRQDPVARFLGAVAIGADGDCWLWTGAIGTHGYGRFHAGGRHSEVMAHRYAYELFVEAIPDGLSIDHLCRTPLCVNPRHLEPVTLAENTRRQMVARSVALTGRRGG